MSGSPSPAASPSPRPRPSGAYAKLADVRKNDPLTAVALWQARVAKSPNLPAFRHHDGTGWRAMTFAEADAAAREIAAGLVSRGLVPGDRVCIVSQTRVEWVLLDIGILLAGGVTVPIYASNTAEQCEFIVRDAGAKMVVVEDEGQREKILSRRDHLFTVTGLIQIAGAPLATAGAAFVQMLADLRLEGRNWLGAHPGELDAHGGTVEPESTFTIIYTSGTTGVPKGVVLTHDHLIAGICSAIRAMQIDHDEVQYLFLPLAHVLGRELVWCSSRTISSRSGRRSWSACRASSRSSTPP